MNKEYYREYYYLERSHWWFQGRLQILENRIKKLIVSKKKPQLKILNIGVATGATTEMLERFGDVISVEYDENCCVFLKKRLGIDAVNASMTNLPFENNSFDVVCVFDVIEHIEDDMKAISEMERIMANDGFYFLTVPAFNFLWSKHDEVNYHFRRYTMSSLSKKIKHCKLKIIYKTYFNFWLFFPITIVRLTLMIFPKKQKSESSGSDFELMNTSKFINKFLYKLFLTEKLVMNLGIRFPFGVSISIIGTKSNRTK